MAVVAEEDCTSERDGGRTSSYELHNLGTGRVKRPNTEGDHLASFTQVQRSMHTSGTSPKPLGTSRGRKRTINSPSGSFSKNKTHRTAPERSHLNFGCRFTQD